MKISYQNTVNAKFAHFMNENGKVMTENFAKRFVDHRDVSFAPQAVAELALHHGECGFHIRALVVVLQKLLLPEIEVVIHISPLSPAKPLIGFLHEKFGDRPDCPICFRPLWEGEEQCGIGSNQRTGSFRGILSLG